MQTTWSVNCRNQSLEGRNLRGDVVLSTGQVLTSLETSGRAATISQRMGGVLALSLPFLFDLSPFLPLKTKNYHIFPLCCKDQGCLPIEKAGTKSHTKPPPSFSTRWFPSGFTRYFFLIESDKHWKSKHQDHKPGSHLLITEIQRFDSWKIP